MVTLSLLLLSARLPELSRLLASVHAPMMSTMRVWMRGAGASTLLPRCSPSSAVVGSVTPSSSE
jgi:hypothetical protein